VSTRVRLTLDVNGRHHHVQVAPMKRLLDVLRQECGLTGTKEGCGEGECGACSVLMDGKSVCSCLVSAAQAEGAKITTVEGLAKGATLSRLQQNFVAFGAAQCGICTPGMLVTSVELLERVKGRVPSDAEVREALAGNLCRCTGYQKIVDAVRATARPAKASARANGRKRAAGPGASRGRRARASASTNGTRPRATTRAGAATRTRTTTRTGATTRPRATTRSRKSAR